MPSDWKKFALRTSNPQSEFIKQVVMVFQTAEVEWESTSSANHVLTLTPAKLSTPPSPAPMAKCCAILGLRVSLSDVAVTFRAWRGGRTRDAQT